MSETKTGLTAALLAAQRKVQAVAKDSKNAHHNYKYASAEDVLIGAREALDDAGLVLMQTGWRYKSDEVVVVTYELRHAESGEVAAFETEVPAVVGQGRPADKALFGALTEGLAYFARGVLLIPRKDAADETPSARDDSKYTPPAKPAPKPADKLKAQAVIDLKAWLDANQPAPEFVTARLGKSVQQFIKDGGDPADALKALTAEVV